MHSRLPRRFSRTLIAVAMIGFLFSPVTADATFSDFATLDFDTSTTEQTVLEGTDALSPADVPDEAIPDSVTTEATEVAVEESGEGDLGRKAVDPFRMVGVTWAEDPEVNDVSVRVQVRTAGEWSEWIELPLNDVGIGRPGTEPLWLDEEADGVSVTVEATQGVPTDVQVSTINPDGNPDAESASEGPATDSSTVENVSVSRSTARVEAAVYEPTNESSTDFATADPEETSATVSAGVAQPNIIPRSGWGAGNGLWGTNKCKAPQINSKGALGVVLHHTAGSNTAKKADSQSIIKSYQAYHVGSHGWCDIGYAFLIDRWGQIFEGRKGGITKQVTGAHAGVTSVNKDATGIAMMGNFDVAKPPTAMKDATVRLTAWRMSLFGNNANGTYRSGGKTYKVLNGHRDVKATACPGRYGYAWLNESGGMRDRVAAMVTEGTTIPNTPGDFAPTNVSATAVTMTWAAVPDAVEYRVVWRPDPAQGSANTVMVTDPEIRLTGLESGGQYVIGVSAISADGGMSPRSPLHTFVTPSGPPPAMPTSIAPKSLSQSSATIGWKAVSGAAEYRVVWRSEPANGTANIEFVKSPEIGLTGLESNSTYVIAVSAVDAAGQTSDRSPLVEFKTWGAAPAMPTNISASTTSSGATVTWPAVSGAVKYRVVWRPDPHSEATVVFVNSPNITLNGLKPSSNYVVAVSAVDAHEQTSTRSPLVKFKTSASVPPAMPTGIKASTVTPTSLTWTWPAVPGAVKYRIVWRAKSASKANVDFVNSPHAVLSGLKQNTEYVFAVSAVNVADQTSKRTGLFTAKTTKSGPPAMPTGIKASTVTPTSLTWTWPAVPGAVKYRIVWRAKSASKANVDFVNSPRAVLSGLKQNTEYVFAVSAVNVADQTSKRTGLFTARTSRQTSASPPAVPTGFKAQTSASSATVTWPAVSGAVKYRVVWRPDPHPEATVVFVDSPSITLNGLKASSNYVIAVSAVNAADQTGTRSPLYSFKTESNTPPATPTGIEASTVTSTSLTWTWPAVSGAVKYRVVWRAKSASKANIGFVDSPRAVLDGLEPNTEYVFAVSAVNAADQTSTRTGLFTAKTAAVIPPTTPTGVEPASITETAVTVEWDPVPGAVKYRVVWRTEPNTVGATVEFVDEPRIRLTGLTARTSYVIGVSAVNEVDETSTRSPLTLFSTAGIPNMPTKVATKSTSDIAVTVGWSAVPGAVKYRVVWRTDPATTTATVEFVNEPEISLTGLSPSTSYVIGVSAVNSLDEQSNRSPLMKFSTTGSAVSLKNSITVPSNGNIKIKGHGYGHGIGMSQHGAQGAARQGVKYDKILDHYYPGTTLGNYSGDIRVHLTKVTNHEVKIEAADGLKLRKMSSNNVTTLPTELNGGKVTHWNIIPRTSNKAQSTLRYKVGSTWRNHSHFNGAAQFEGPSSLVIFQPNGTKHRYRGALRSVPRSSGATTRYAVNVLGVESYVKGVVAREMPAGWHSEALKAQSVAARTYGVRSIKSGGTFDICDTTSCQVYGGVSAETSSTNAAIDGTKGKVLMYQGKPAFTQFSSSSGGWTNQGSQPYLKPVRDDWDNFSGNSVHNWTITVKASTIEKKHTSIGKLKSITITKRNGYGNGGGRVTSVTLKGSKASKTISGTTARWDFGMRSDWFGF